MPPSELQARIVDECASGVQAAMKNTTDPRVIFLDDYVVKFKTENILNEGDTQAFVYAKALNSPDAPRVPRVWECFSCDIIQYLVMERIYLPTVKEWINGATNEAEMQSRHEEACKEVANALRWLFGLSAPDGAEVGLIEGEYVLTWLHPERRANNGLSPHFFFGRDTAPLRYTDASALERHINKARTKDVALTCRPRRAPPLTVNISHERLVMIQSDIHPDNFLIDPETRQVTLIDFGRVSALPESFISFTMRSPRNAFSVDIARFLDVKPSENLPGIGAAKTIFVKSSSGKFGLDKDGFPLQNAKSR